MNSRRAWIVYGVGIVAYIVAVLQRATLGVAGVDAIDRFEVQAAAMSTLAVLQLVVYAAMQIPVGVLIDRFGARRLILGGLALMVLGQAVVALAGVLPVAVVGRVLVGAGDAAIFVSVMRLTTSWFSGPRVPQLSQWMGNLGQLGQVLSAVPFSWLLHQAGWTTAFLSAAATALLALVLVFAVVADRPRGMTEVQTTTTSLGVPVVGIRAAMREGVASLRRPGTQLGFWSHFSTQSSATMFSLLWGFPFLVSGIGLDERVAARLLLVVVVAGVTMGPILGLLSARFPYRRSNLVLAIVAAILAMWAVVLLWPGTPPLWLIVALLFVVGVGGPGSLVGFDFARSFNPRHVHGVATGIVNVGGFLASFVMMFAVGLVLDVAGAGAAPDLDAFRLAFCVQFVVIGAGAVMIVSARRRTRRRFLEDDGIEVAPLWVALVARWRRRR